MHHDQVIDIDRKDGVIVVAINDGVVSVDANVSSSNGIIGSSVRHLRIKKHAAHR